MKLNVEVTDASQSFKFWTTFIKEFTTDNLPSLKSSIFLNPCLFVLVLFCQPDLFSCVKKQVTTSKKKT